jgi:glucokinase
MVELAIGIDIGGTSTKVALINASGEFLAKSSFPSHTAGGADSFFPNLLKAIKSLLEEVGIAYQLVGIGIGAPSCNERDGTIEGAANLPFQKPYPIVRMLEDASSVPVWLTKDGNAALLGERRFGIARNIDNFILLTLGTGLGCAIMMNGRLIKGGSGMAGETGHIRVANNHRKCGCGKRGCLETYVSAVGLKRTVMALVAEETIPSVLRSYSFEQLDAHLIYLAAQEGDELARLAFEITGKVLGEKLAELVTVFEPEAIVLAGGMAEAGTLLTRPLHQRMESELLGFHKNKVRILTTALATNDAALLGAASLVWDQLRSVPVS